MFIAMTTVVDHIQLNMLVEKLVFFTMIGPLARNS